jgi:hypothetical protein
MSIALEGAEPGFLGAFAGNKCIHGHARGAKALARYLTARLGTPERPAHRSSIQGQGILFYDRTELDHIDLWTTLQCLPRYGPGNPSTMSWTTVDANDANELWFWPLPN